MATRTRTHQRSTASTRRFAKPGAPPRGRRATGGAGHARPLAVRRRKPQKSGTAQALETLTGLVAGKKAASGGAKGAKAAGGMAMLTAAAGLAFKNRDKLTAMLKRDGGPPQGDPSAPPPGTTGAEVHAATTRANATTPLTGEAPGGAS
jgi:hypothetical protein